MNYEESSKEDQGGDVQHLVLFSTPFMPSFLSKANILQEVNWPLPTNSIVEKTKIDGGKCCLI